MRKYKAKTSGTLQVYKGQQDPGGGVTNVEIENLLENFKTDILGTLVTQLNIMQVK